MEPARKVTAEAEILPSYFPVPGLGLVPVNAYVLKSAQPVLVDTGLHQDRDKFMTELESVVDPDDLTWLWLTHPDQDHVGSLLTLLERAPNIRIVTTFLGLGLLSLFTTITPDRIYLLNPGERLDVGDRTLVCMRPPSFDNPATTAFFDTKSRILFSSDFFGAVLQSPAQEASSISASDLRDGQKLWGTVDAPWLHQVERASFENELENIRKLEPEVVLSSHLPPARAILPQMLQTIAAVPDAQPFVGPNQAQLEAMLAQMTQGSGPTA
jgi:flavorubredoxin